ncbi:T9SS type A sorting domain-containing protein [Ulvibacter antarcticus]|uniref:Putative secreted protein (Por secretion system target) n=1 Tax=Ulvibacter antarcticus TaxID=442714 RepID=A0A3L9YAQ8_9FLAO|nr:T9SS type A sorting domain-containing protein [Ulvibacter antarcticus]RMA57801.1 putative secreted protein (Por secretion system target) [Ulvibacter antarcticus]
MKKILTLFFVIGCSLTIFGQSIARQWNEEVLNGIRNDFARPTVHARNLFHTSVAMYDAWAVFDPNADTFFLDKEVGGFYCEFEGFSPAGDPSEARKKAISYAVYRLIRHRFSEAPRKENIFTSIDALMQNLGYDLNYTSVDYNNGDGAALGNYIAAQLIAFGLQDGSNEALGYENQSYEPVNEPLNTDISGNPTIANPNHWQPLRVENWIDQSGNTIPGGQPPFLGPEWGSVIPFSLQEEEKTINTVNGNDYVIYHDPGQPSYIQDGLGMDDPYKWGFSLVAAWSSHMDPADGVMIDISPAAIGNYDSTNFPTTFNGFKTFYNYQDGGDPSHGRTINPVSSLPYEPNMVLRGDYTRVLAEFWADGPESETPPGHWFTLLNYVSDQPQLAKKFKGRGRVLTDLEWDIKGYFILGGAMHDVAVTSWGLKGYYDYIRPISAIRYMADNGQSSDSNLLNYNPHGMPLSPGMIEVVQEGDPLAGAFNENVGKIKLFAWRGPGVIADPNTDVAGVGWIFADEWFPYQRPSFVTPPFAGYVSGHSTFSRAAAEILTLFTGDAFFPGGMGTFNAPADSFLKFEKGPSADVQLQWATYRDASDQTSLSRIWGGIHPPIDDIPGRILGEKIGHEAFRFAERYFTAALASEGALFPNPATEEVILFYHTEAQTQLTFYDLLGRSIHEVAVQFDTEDRCNLNVSAFEQGVYFVVLKDKNDKILLTKRLIKE